ncbi:MAG: helix-turn-helix domain-containing protein [Sphingobacterium sp.]|jgi:hypothetical protein|nr:helix-turn-helix domain-containing protein [Sphingobacterium sp.]
MKEIDQKVIDLKRQGNTMIEISKILGIPRNTVYHYYNRGTGILTKRRKAAVIKNGPVSIHDLRDIKTYPCFFFHLTSETINIHSHKEMFEGDTVQYKNKSIMLNLRLPMNKNTMNSNYHNGCFYYEFTYIVN